LPPLKSGPMLPSDAASEIVKNRQGIYGHPGQVYDIWSIMMSPIFVKMQESNRVLPTTDECSMMLILLKCAREINSNYPADYRDNLDDIAGYANVLFLTKEANNDK
jgi:Domain of unknown function (DUF6378)